LSGIEVRDWQLALGAAVRHYDIVVSLVVKRALPALAAVIGDPQVRNRGTLGGPVANNDPAADYPAAVLALGAAIVTTRREIAAADYLQGMFATALEEGEIIVRILLPLPRRAAYAKYPHLASGYAMAGRQRVNRLLLDSLGVCGRGISGAAGTDDGPRPGWRTGGFRRAAVRAAPHGPLGPAGRGR
jgi:CO/xanthine dehydrogenase FAD-binding subunit